MLPLDSDTQTLFEDNNHDPYTKADFTPPESLPALFPVAVTGLSRLLSQNGPEEKRALLISIRHVHRKAGSSLGNLANLEFAHRDAKELKSALITSHGYKEDDITLMMDDDDNCPKDMWPTRGRILRQIDRLISNAPENCHFFFYFSGHGVEVEADSDDRASMRADGKEDEIVAADGKPILDHMLHDRLITPLQKLKGSKLFALFDCCHSETLLDLQSGNGPNHYSRVWSIGRGQMFRGLATVIVTLLKMSKKYCKKRETDQLVARRASSKLRQPTYKAKEVGELDVICLSACRDGQLAHDDCERGLTFTKCFLKAMATKPGITWTELRTTLKEFISEIQTRYELTYLQDPGSESDQSYMSWTQSPRICTGSHTDLTQPVSL